VKEATTTNDVIVVTMALSSTDHSHRGHSDLFNNTGEKDVGEDDDYYRSFEGYPARYDNEEIRTLFRSSKQSEIDSVVKPIRFDSSKGSGQQPISFPLAREENSSSCVLVLDESDNSLLCSSMSYLPGQVELITLRSLDNGNKLQTIHAPYGTTAVMDKIDENSFVSGGHQRHLMVWCRSGKGEPFKSVKTIDHNKSTVTCLLVLCHWHRKEECRSEDSRSNDSDVKVTYLASGSGDETVKLWRLSDEKCLSILKGHKGEVTTLCEIPSNHYNEEDTGLPVSILASGSEDKTIKLWDLDREVCIRTLEGHQDGLRCIILLKKRRVLVSCSSDPTIRFWTTNNSTSMKIIPAHRCSIMGVGELIEDEVLVSVSYADGYKLWNMEGDCLYRIPSGNISGLTITPEGFVCRYFHQDLLYWKRYNYKKKQERGRERKKRADNHHHRSQFVHLKQQLRLKKIERQLQQKAKELATLEVGLKDRELKLARQEEHNDGKLSMTSLRRPALPLELLLSPLKRRKARSSSERNKECPIPCN